MVSADARRSSSERALRHSGRVGGDLDAIDLKILSELQTNGRIANNDLASRVGMSPPPCLRRVRALLAGGYIKGFRALLDTKRLGFEVTSFVAVQLTSQSNSCLAEFETVVRELEPVRECWLVSGDTDYLLRCVVRNMSEFESMLLQFASLAMVKNVKSLLTLRKTKDEGVPLELLR